MIQTLNVILNKILGYDLAYFRLLLTVQAFWTPSYIPMNPFSLWTYEPVSLLLYVPFRWSTVLILYFILKSLCLPTTLRKVYQMSNDVYHHILCASLLFVVNVFLLDRKRNSTYVFKAYTIYCVNDRWHNSIFAEEIKKIKSEFSSKIA